MNKQIFEIYGITEEDFEKWCKENDKNKYDKTTKEIFFKKILNGQIIKDENGNIIKKNGGR